MRIECRIATVLLMSLAASIAFGDDAPDLQHNPFSRPPSKIVAEVEVAGKPRVAGEIVLTATMVTAGKGMAHVNGQVLRPGDEIYGRRLLRVYEDRVVFLDNGKEATIYVRSSQDEVDEEKSPRRQRQ